MRTPKQLSEAPLTAGEVAIWAAAYAKWLLEKDDESGAFAAADRAVMSLRQAVEYFTERKALGVFSHQMVAP